jgi:hypothetical protein
VKDCVLVMVVTQHRVVKQTALICIPPFNPSSTKPPRDHAIKNNNNLKNVTKKEEGKKEAG